MDFDDLFDLEIFFKAFVYIIVFVVGIAVGYLIWN
jgi:hypothetical protein